MKFVRPGVRPVVHIRADDPAPAGTSHHRSGAEFVRIWIEDNGIGMDEKDQQRIFRMFERLHPAEKFDGTGIGLMIARKAAERMGGTLGFDSEQDRGSRFWD